MYIAPLGIGRITLRPKHLGLRITDMCILQNYKVALSVTRVGHSKQSKYSNSMWAHCVVLQYMNKVNQSFYIHQIISALQRCADETETELLF